MNFDEIEESYESEFQHGNYYLPGDKKYFYENGKKILCEYDAEEDGWFEVL